MLEVSHKVPRFPNISGLGVFERLCPRPPKKGIEEKLMLKGNIALRGFLFSYVEGPAAISS